jgi:hypothetical protein
MFSGANRGTNYDVFGWERDLGGINYYHKEFVFQKKKKNKKLLNKRQNKLRAFLEIE